MTSVPDELLGATPGDRARAAADALGDRELTRWCADLVAGRAAYGSTSAPDPGWLAGRAIHTWGAPDHFDEDTEYWPRVWAARTLHYVWDDSVTADVVAALGDPAWRVREMGAKVCARWEVGAAADACCELVADDVARVRAAALRVLAAVGESEHVDTVRDALDDPEPNVVAAAQRALKALERRLNRSLTGGRPWQTARATHDGSVRHGRRPRRIVGS